MSWNYYSFQFCRKLGIDNHTETSIANQFDERVSKPYCSSSKCTGSYSEVKYIRKHVASYNSDCPDCNHALIWRKSV